MRPARLSTGLAWCDLMDIHVLKTPLKSPKGRAQLVWLGDVED